MAAAKKRLYHEILEQFNRLISDGGFSPGDPLPTEQQLTRRFGVSQGTMREVFRILENDGVVVSRHGGLRYLSPLGRNVGAVKNAFADASFAELNQMRQIFEPAMLEYLCDKADSGDITRMAAEYEESLNGSSQLLPYFHAAIAELTGNRLIVEVIRCYAALISKTDERAFQIRARLKSNEERLEEHREILDALRERDANRAKLALRRHLLDGEG